MIRFHNRCSTGCRRPSRDTQQFTRARKKVKPPLPVADPARLPAADLQPGGRSTTSSPTAASWSSRRAAGLPAGDAGRVLGGGVPPRPQHGPPRYNWNRIFSGGAGSLEYMFEFSGLGGDLGGEISPDLISWVADFRRRCTTSPPAGTRASSPASNVNRARRIDTRLTDPLGHLPPSTFGGRTSIPFGDPRRNLAFRNLTRGADGEAGERPADGHEAQQRRRRVTPLTKAQIIDGSGGARSTSSRRPRGRVAGRTRRCGSTSCARRS